MSGEANDVTIHGYPPIPSEIPTTKDGWRQRAIGLKLRLSAAESQNQALQEERDLLQSRLSGQTKLTGMLQEQAEKAEALLRRIWKEGLYEDQTSELIEAFFEPTQETDPIRCQSRCDQWPNCQHDWRSWHDRPTQETDPE